MKHGMARFLLVAMFTLLGVSLSGIANAQGNKNVQILFVNTIGNEVAGVELPEVLLTPAGYENVTTVKTMNDFNREWENRNDYGMLIFAYHSFSNDANLEQWLRNEAAALAEWVNSGGIFLGTAGRDSQEKPIADVFGLRISDPGIGAEAIVPLEPGTPFAEGIDGNILDASASGDNTPLNGQIYDEPLPDWVEYVITRNAADDVSSVAGHYGDGVLWLGAGFEIQNIGTGEDAESSKFTGYRTLWENFLDWATGSAIRPREPESKSGAVPGTWGIVKYSPVVYIEEQHVDVNTTFDVDVRISRAKNLAGFQISLNYNPYNLQFIRIQEGKALSRDGQTSFWRPPDVDSESGNIAGAASIVTGAGGVNVDDDVAMTLTFRAKELGQIMLSLHDIKISGPDSRQLPFLTNNAFITISPPWDVVPDSVIDVLDMIAVGQHLANPQLAALLTVEGDTGLIPDAHEYNPDVDRNGIVDVDDLILVSNHFGEAYQDSDTARQPNLRVEARRAYDLISAGPPNSPDISKLKAHLMHLLAMDRSTSLPALSRLLPNYPNPFNPDTWMPYHLAQAGHVTIRIYNISGQLARTLNLGHKEAGFYTSKSNAAHWDGKNDSGEELASGLYFYTMRAGDFAAIRKMLLVE
jgi:hypothetical protein